MKYGKKLGCMALDDLKSCVIQKLTKRPLCYTVLLKGSSIVNRVIKIVKYCCFVGFSLCKGKCHPVICLCRHRGEVKV